MSDGLTTDRLVTLRNRWQSDPTSRIFLQLAEEHRHLGQIQEALAVLDRGLREHPGYLSALVAKGRCHLELGEPEPARAVLERVVKQDPTQMVANKLLVRAYLETGDPARARERLDLYSLLNDSDPEIEALRRRIQAIEQPPKPSPREPEPPPSETQLEALSEAPSAAPPPVFSAPPSPARRDAPLDGTDIFGLAHAQPAWENPLVHPSEPDSHSPYPEPPRAKVPISVDEVFPGLYVERSRDRYLAALSAEGIFPVALPRLAPPSRPPVIAHEPSPPPAAPVSEPPPLAQPEPRPGPSPWATSTAPFDLSLPAPHAAFPPAPETVFASQPDPVFHLEEEPVFTPESEPVFEPEPWPTAPPPAAAPLFAVPPEGFRPTDEEPTISEVRTALAPEPEAAPRLATVTLADLYVKQGHPAEAERLYRQVLEREPESQAALSGLERLAGMERRLRPLEARDLLADFQEPASASPADDGARTRHLLHSYLQRLRERSPRDVS